MSGNYFDDIGAANEDELDEEEIDEEDFHGELDDDDDDDDDDVSSFLSDHVSKSSNSFDEMDDIEEYNGPRFDDHGMDMEGPDTGEAMSIFQEDIDEPVREKKKNKFTIILLIVVLSFGAIAGLFAYSMFARDSAPSIREVHIESDNFDDHSVAQYGNMITLTFTFNKALEGLPTVIIMGRQVEVFGEGMTYYAKYFVQEQEEEDQLVTFTIKDYQDSFHKTGDPITMTTDSSKVIILGDDYT